MTLILFPLKAELELFIKHFKGSKKVELSQFQHSPVYTFPDQMVMCAFGGQGKVQYALHAQALGLHFDQVRSILCIGSAGALVNTLRPGDVVVGERTVEHDFKVLSRPIEAPAFSASEALLEKFKGLHTQASRVFFGPVASGDEDIMSMERGEQIHKVTKALCVAWEGAGGARAAKLLNKSFLEIRAITDLSRANSRQEFEQHLDQAMEAVAQLMERALPLP